MENKKKKNYYIKICSQKENPISTIRQFYEKSGDLIPVDRKLKFWERTAYALQKLSSYSDDELVDPSKMTNFVVALRKGMISTF